MTISKTHPAVDASPRSEMKARVPARNVPDHRSPEYTEPKLERADPDKLKAVLAENNISLNFRRDEESGRIVVEMVDSKTGVAVRQIPSEVSLRLSEMFSKIPGRLFNARA